MLSCIRRNDVGHTSINIAAKGEIKSEFFTWKILKNKLMIFFTFCTYCMNFILWLLKCLHLCLKNPLTVIVNYILCLFSESAKVSNPSRHSNYFDCRYMNHVLFHWLHHWKIEFEPWKVEPTWKTPSHVITCYLS